MCLCVLVDLNAHKGEEQEAAAALWYSPPQKIKNRRVDQVSGKTEEAGEARGGAAEVTAEASRGRLVTQTHQTAETQCCVSSATLSRLLIPL